MIVFVCGKNTAKIVVLQFKGSYKELGSKNRTKINRNKNKHKLVKQNSSNKNVAPSIRHVSAHSQLHILGSGSLSAICLFSVIWKLFPQQI